MGFGKKAVPTVLITLFILGIVFPVSYSFSSTSPTIVVSAPENNTVVTTSSTGISGYVTNTSILRVNGTSVSFSSNGFFSHTVNNLALGSNSIKISATNSSGLVVNKYVTVVYDPNAVIPVINITSPTDNLEVYQNFVTISGSVLNNEKLTIKVNNGTESNYDALTGSFDINISLSPGDNTIIVAAENSGIKVSKTLRIKYVNSSVISDIRVNGSNVNDYIAVTTVTATLTGKAAGVSGLNVTNNGQPVSANFNPATGDFDFTTDLTPGANNMVIKAQGANIYETRNVLIYYGSAGPQVYNVTPENGSTVFSTSLTVKGTVRDTKTLIVSGSAVTINSDGSFSRVLTLSGNQWNTITLVATSSTGVSTTHTYSVYCHSDPAVFIAAPQDNTVVYNNSVSVTGFVYNAISGGLTVNGVTVSFSANGSYSKSITLTPGLNNITVSARNSAGVTATKSVTVDYRGGPNIYNFSPADNTIVTTSTVTIAGRVANTSTNGLKINGTVVNFDGQGNFSKVLTLNAGSNTVTVTATDGIFTTTRSIEVRYDASPIILVTSPDDRDAITIECPDGINRKGFTTVTDSMVIKGRVFNTETGGLLINGEKVSFNSSDGSFTKKVNLTNIVNQVTIEAYNGNFLSTKELYIYYQGLPSITVTSHYTGDTVDTPYIIIEGTVFPADPLEISSFTINDADYTFTINEGSFRSLPVSLKPKENTITLKLTNIYGGQTSRIININYNNGPAITIKSPLDGSTVYSNVATIKGTLDRADLNTLTIAGSSVKVNSDRTFSHQVTLKSGINDIIISASLGDVDTTKTLKLIYSAVAKEGSEVRTDLKDGEEAKAFEDAVKVKLSKGSIGLKTTSLLKILDPSDVEDIPDQSALVGPMVSLGWDGEKPLRPYKITLKYDQVVRENQAHKVCVFYYDEDEDEWQVLGGIVDTNARTVSIETLKEGYFVAAVYFRTFDDVINHWAQRDIEFLISQGSVSGATSARFLPNDNVTRAQFVTFLVKTLGITPYKPENSSYSDVGKKHWGYEYIEGALRAGIVSGVSHDKFAPDRNITREEAAVIISRAANLKILKEQELVKVFSLYTDNDTISFWAKSDMAAIIKSKIMSGSDGKLMPKRNTTRAQAAAMIARLYESVNKSKGAGK